MVQSATYQMVYNIKLWLSLVLHKQSLINK